ncbi:MAG: TonB-dependent receptor [Bacteroidales bacterium]|nr:TonB-dependent receptor [Bacteroidales bacterium]
MKDRLPVFLRRALLALALLAVAWSAAAQRKAWGTVYEEGGLPAVGAVVMETGSASNAAMTDAQGRFALTLEGESVTVSLFGFKDVTVPLSDGEMKIILQQDSKVLEEAVVIGYGVQKKEFLTGSVASRTGKEILKAPVANVSQTMYGQFSGLALHSNYGTAGDDGATFLIRGKNQPDGNAGNNGGFEQSHNQPLAVIDGIRCSVSEISRLNPNDIESISVLKDAASTAVYGLEGSNGVIVVTTKSGSSSGTNSIRYDGSVTFTRNTAMVDLMDADEYILWNNRARRMDGLDIIYTPENIQKLKDAGIYAPTDWLQEVFNPFGLTHQHNISASGGNERVTYYSSLGVMSQKGIIRNNDYQRYNFRNNLSVQLARGLRYEMNVSAEYSRKHLPVIDLQMQSEYSPMRAAFFAAPILAKQWTDPETGISYPLGVYNGVYTYTPSAVLDDGFKNTNTLALNALSKLEYSFDEVPFLKGLKASVFGGARYGHTVYDQYQEPFKQASFDPNTLSVRVINFIPFSETYYFKSQSYNWTLILRPQINYDRTFGKHSVSLLGLFEGEYWYYDHIDGWGNDFATSDPIDLDFANKAITGANAGSHNHSGNCSFVYRLNYNYDGRYIFETSARANASYLLPQENRWGFFPSVSVAWVASNENFIKDNVGWIDHLKLRASIGQTGSVEGLGAYSYLEKFYTTGQTHAYGIGLQPTAAFYTGGYGDRNLTWSRMTDYNIGLDAMLLGKKLTVGADFFYQYRDGIIEGLDAAYAPSIGGNHPSSANSMRVDNRGIELTVRHDNWFSGGLTYSVQGMVSWARNKVLSSANQIGDHPSYRMVLGRPMDELYGFQCIRLLRDQEDIDNAPDPPAGLYYPGEPLYRDVNGDGKISSDYDYVRIGYSTTPELNFSLNLSVGFRRWSLSALFQGAAMSSLPLTGNYRNTVIDNTIYTRTFYGLAFTNGNLALAKDSWYIDEDGNVNPNAKYPRLHQGWNGTTMWHSDIWVVDGSYVRLKNLQLTYSLPEKIARAVGMSAASIYVAGTNLFTLSHYKWIDPENPGLNNGFVPQQKTYSVGLNVTF